MDCASRLGICISYYSKHPVRILFFIDSLTAGGKERRLVQLMEGLHGISDIEFCLVIMSMDINYSKVFDLNIEIHYLLRKNKKDFKIFKKFYRLCKQYKPDLVHCWDSMTCIYAVPACRLLHIKLINGMVVDAPPNLRIFNKHWLRGQLTFRFSDKIVGNSQAGLKAYCTPNYKSVCIYNGIDFKRFDNLKDPDLMRDEIFNPNTRNLFIVGMVAAFEKRKDYYTIMKSALILTRQIEHIRFVFVGDGTFLKNIKGMVPDSLIKRIIFLGKRSDIESVVNIFDIGVLLTNTKVHGEGISNSIIEYMALKKPVIATRGGGTNEIVIDNQNGFVIEPGNSDQLNEKILLLMREPELANKLGEQGWKMVESKFKLEKMTNHFLKLYYDLVN